LKHSNLIFFLLFLIASVLSNYTYAQNIFDSENPPEKLNYKGYTIEDGLSSSNINALHQDHNGFLWIGTPNGLNRFDGREFKSFYPNYPTFKNSLSDGCVLNIDQFKDCLYIGTQKGISVYNLSTQKFINSEELSKNFDAYRSTNVGIYVVNNIFTIVTDSTLEMLDTNFNRIYYWNASNRMSPFHRFFFGIVKPASINNNIFLLHTSEGIAYFDVNKKKLYNKEYNPLGLNLYTVSTPFTFGCNTNNSIYVSAGWGENFVICNLYEPLYDTIFINKNRHSKKKFITVYDVCGVGKNSLLAASTKGLFYYNMQTKVRNLYSFDSEKDPAENKNNLRSILIDNEKNIWIGSYEGLYKINKLNNTTTNLLFEKLNLQNRFCNYVLKNREHELVFCFNSTDSLFFLETIKGIKKLVGYKLNISRKGVLYALQMSPNQYLVSTWVGTFLFDKAKKITTSDPFIPDSLKKVSACFLYTDMKQNLWMGFREGRGLFRYNLQTKSSKYFNHYTFHESDGNYLPMRNVMNVAELSDGRIAFTNNQGNGKLCIWDTLSDRIKVVHAKNRIGNYEPYNGTVSGIVCDSNDMLWLATYNGLVKYDLVQNTYRQYGRKEGLTNGNVLCLSVDRYNNIWIGTYGGLYYLNQRTNVIHHSEREHTLKNAFIDYTFYDSSTNHLYMTCNSNFFDLNIDEIFVNKRISRTYIDQVFVNQQPISLSQNTFGSSDCNFQFNFSSINLTNGENNQYFYQLLPIDTNWVFSGKQTQINFSNLVPDDYVFKVRARNGDDIWGSEVSYTFHISKPFYLTWWFVFLMICITIGVINYFFQYRLRQIQKIEKIRNKLSRDLHDDIGSTLSSINILSRSAQLHAESENDEKTKTSLEKIHERSQRLLENMKDIIWNINPNNDSLDELVSRMREYASSIFEAKNIYYEFYFPDAGECKTSIPMEIKSNLYLIFKEAVNNLSKYSGCIKAMITLSIQTHKITLLVEDDGRGFEQTNLTHQSGLLNMKHRALELKGDFSIQSSPGKGTQIRLMIPY